MTKLRQFSEAGSDIPSGSFIGKKIIACISQFYEGEPHVRSQNFGEIIGIKNGRIEYLSKEKNSFIPIIQSAFVFAPRGNYVLRETGESIVNPDYIVSWRLDLEDNLEESEWTANTAPHFNSIVGEEWDFNYSYDEEYLKSLMDTFAANYIDKTILVGLRDYSHDKNGNEKLFKQSQLHGFVIRASFSEGVVVRLRDNSEFFLPPDLSLLQRASPGDYTLESTGEVIINPDLITMMSRHKL